MATSYLQIITSTASGILASGAQPQHPSYFQTMFTDALGAVRAHSLLGVGTANEWSPRPMDAVTGAGSSGCASWQIDLPCFTVAAPLRTDNNYNVPIFSHGNFEVGIKPSGTTYALKGDAYVNIPNTEGGIDKYHTSGLYPGGISESRITWMFTTPSGKVDEYTLTDMYRSVELANGENRYLQYGNIGIIMGHGGGYDGNTHKGPPHKGGGYIGPVGLPPVDAASLIPTKTGFSAGNGNNGLWKNGVKLTHAQETGCIVPSLDPWLVNADAADAGPGGTPSNQIGEFFKTGDSSSFIGTLGRRNSNLKNLKTTENLSPFSFVRRSQKGEMGTEDDVASGNLPNSPNPIRLMFWYGDPATSDMYDFYDWNATDSISGTANVAKNWDGSSHDGWGTAHRLDFGNDGHSGDLLLYGVGHDASETDWSLTTNSSHACGDPHILPLFGERYDL